MLRRLAPALLVSALACGGPDAKTGIFAGGVAGVHYASVKHQGTTDGQGRFTYDAGEVVTFSLGSITLGSTKGASQVTPFDLFAVTMPSSEAELGPKLRGAGVATPYTRAINVIYLLSNGAPTPVGDSAGQTDLLITWLYKLTVDRGNYNVGAVIGILTFVVLGVVALITYRNSGSYKNEEAFR